MVLRWSPADFWSATPHELSAADELLSGDSKKADYARFKEEVEKGCKGRGLTTGAEAMPVLLQPAPRETFFPALIILPCCGRGFWRVDLFHVCFD